MSQTTKLLGIGTKLVHNGRELEIKPLVADQIGEFEAWVEEELWKAHRRSRRVLPDDEYDRRGNCLQREIGLNQFSYPRPEFFKAMFTLPGLKKVTWISLRDRYKDLDEEDVAKIVEAKFDEIVKALQDAESDPTTGTGPTS